MAAKTNVNGEQIEKARDTMESGLNSTVLTFRRAADQFTQVLGLAGPQAEELARKSSQNIEALSQASNILVKGAQEISREWFDVMQERMAKNLDAMNKLGPLPWKLTFSYGRALQAAPQKAWSGKSENVAAAQRAFTHRAIMNSLATRGQWKQDLEKKAA